MAHTLKHAGKATVGEFIRAYEFEPIPGCPERECYHEGLVINADFDNGYRCYVICCTRHVFGGKEQPESAGLCVFVPHQTSFMEYDSRVTKIDPPKPQPRASLF
jgi:hypothetical protein